MHLFLLLCCIFLSLCYHPLIYPASFAFHCCFTIPCQLPDPAVLPFKMFSGVSLDSGVLLEYYNHSSSMLSAAVIAQLNLSGQPYFLMFPLRAPCSMWSTEHAAHFRPIHTSLSSCHYSYTFCFWMFFSLLDSTYPDPTYPLRTFQILPLQKRIIWCLYLEVVSFLSPVAVFSFYCNLIIPGLFRVICVHFYLPT